MLEGGQVGVRAHNPSRHSSLSGHACGAGVDGNDHRSHGGPMLSLKATIQLTMKNKGNSRSVFKRKAATEVISWNGMARKSLGR